MNLNKYDKYYQYYHLYNIELFVTHKLFIFNTNDLSYNNSKIKKKKSDYLN